ncbi:MAG TPA: hypothetical protein PK047_09955 [Saprospiraceae bacterium]|nr:hypothetical protein [Saprospiraceae bacterium]HRP42612.1 hypothetical protein [Saprospiraceae bacterium]
MSTVNTQRSNIPLGWNKSKDTQLNRVLISFAGKPKTMLMVATDINIKRSNVCRYVAQLRKFGKIHFIEKNLCQISKHRAGYYTTNPELFVNE